MDEVQATVRVIDGQMVLDDPAAIAVIRAVGKCNCAQTLAAQQDRVAYFRQRVTDLGLSPGEVVIVLINADDSHGRMLAEVLVPRCDWQAMRDRGEVPFARGLAGREGIQKSLEAFDTEAADKLAALASLAVVVVDHGVAEVFAVEATP